MTHAKRLWSIWQALLSAFAWAFTRPSFRRFAEWITAMAINGEEHTITQSVLALERPADWKALESFAEYGAWHPDYVTASLTRLVETAPGRLWHGYHISAVDDTKVHRNSPDVWGTCTFHEYTARCPNRAPTVRAHNWVVLGALLDNPGQPPWCLPLSGRLYFRKSQLPLQSQDSDHTVVFRTKCELVVELIREQARITGGRHLGIFDGAYALRSVVRPLVQPGPGHPRIEFLTRLRPDARLQEPRGASGSDRFRICCGENSKSVWPQYPEIFEASERLSAYKATVATHVSLEPESAWPFRAQPVEPVVRFFRKSHCPGQKFVAKALRDIVVNYVCWDRAERLWQFGARTKPACRPGRAAVRGCMLIDTRKPGRPTCGLRKTCRSVG